MDYKKKSFLYSLCYTIKSEYRDLFRDTLNRVLTAVSLYDPPSSHIKINIYQLGSYIAVYFLDSCSPPKIRDILSMCSNKGLRVITNDSPRLEKLGPNAYVTQSGFVFFPGSNALAADTDLIQSQVEGFAVAMEVLGKLSLENPKAALSPQWFFEGFVAAITRESKANMLIWSSEN